MTQSEQPQSVASILSGLIAARGITLLNDRRRVLGLLRDKAPGDVKTIRLLMIAFDEGVPQRFKSAPVSEIDVGREVNRLNVNVGITLDLAQDVVQTWASAVGGYAAPPALLGAASDMTSGTVTVPSENPAAGASQTPAAPPSVQPLPAVTPLPLVQPLPGHAGALPSVQPLPTTASANASPQATQPAVLPLPPDSAPPVASAAPVDKWKWVKIAAGAVIILGALLRFMDAYQKSQTQQPASTPQQQQAPAPDPTPAPAPERPSARLTPEGLPVLSGENGPTLNAKRIENSTNSLVVPFGVMIGDTPLSYQAAFAFDANKPKGAGKIMAFRGSQQSSTDVLSADHFTADGKLYIRVFGKLKSNPIGTQPLCVVVEVAPRYDMIDVSTTGSMSAYGLDQRGNCDANQFYGNGYVK